ncbi:beta-ketoacyl synthase domain-containing protein [Hypoxylon crocopeplum]|nr:beta-ketoacyl synthase domain-containing protein [Hypoxylon crocopeplum]
MAYKQPSSEPIVIVGSSCRFAGDATSPTKLWDVLCEAPDLSREVPPERFNAQAFYHPDGEYHGTTNSIKAYWLEQDHRVFDAGLFNITPKEAEAIDPQQRLLLEVVYEAMESAGYGLNTWSGKKVAVFAGVMTADYDTLSQRDDLSTSQYYATGNARSIISNRVSYFFNFHGPSMTIDTACSSSLVALHQAVLSLRSGESTMACVTGVNLMITPEQFLVESSLHMLSPTGKSRMWDASADGYARGEGVAALLLKPLSRALADGDQIAAVIRETGVNSDGRTKGITLPNPEAQAALIRDTYQKTGLDSVACDDRCQYFEAHGTGTPAGDPREAAAIYEAFFGQNTSVASAPNENVSGSENLLVGSVKTVLGHTEGAAGLAGLLKVVQSMKHGLIPPNLHLESINPAVEPYCTRLKIPTSLVPWPSPPAGHPKRASVNSFGFGGANAHVILESYDPRIHDVTCQPHVLDATPSDIKSPIDTNKTSLSLPLLLSAASQKSLRAVVGSYRDYLLQHPDACHGQLAWALFARRTALPYRLAVSATSRAQALEALEEVLHLSSSNNIPGDRYIMTSNRPKILGVFTGQGAQWATMSRSLFDSNEVYRNTIRDLDRVLGSVPEPPDWTLEQQLMAEGQVSLVNVAAISQPLCTALQIGLVDLLRSLGIEFHTVVGHSSGEIAAAYTAGRISARDAILVSYYRGSFARLAGSPEGQKGGMLAAGMPEEEALQFCEAPIFNGRLHVAASNAPSSITLSGDLDAIQMAHEELTKNKKFSRVLRVDSAYHSPHMIKPAVEYVKALQDSGVETDTRGNETIWVSSVHGRSMNDDEELKTGYWRDNMVNMVRFHDAIVNATSQYGPFDCALEIGPHPALKGPFTQTVKPLGHTVPYSCPLDRSKDDTLAFSDFLGFLWCQYGPENVELRKYIEQSPSADLLRSCLTDLPSYPWDHSQTHYLESRLSRQFHFKSAAPHELLGARTRDDNEHELRWRNLLRLEKLPWVEHHSFQGQALLPASAYCIMALDAAQSLLNDRPASVVELQDVQLLNGINIDRESVGMEVLFTLAVLPQKKDRDTTSTIEANFTLASCPTDGTTTMRLNMTGALRIHLGEPAPDALPSRQASQSETFQATPESFYKTMEQTGLSYTGPFRALTSVKRRYNYCSATLKRSHPQDTTALRISPATLDSCFQSAFLTYASPGDGALWTSFLPIRIDRVCFNLAMYNRASVTSESENLTVDTNMADIQPSTPDSKATFVVDMNIFNEDGDMEIQVEGLTVAALAHTLPKNDYELYLNTVTDVDPTDAIIQDTSRSGEYDPAFVESCARVATFFVRNNWGTDGKSIDLSSYYKTLQALYPSVLGGMSVDYWSRDTEQTIDTFIRDSDYCDQLSLIRGLDDYQPDFVSTVLNTLINETHHLSYFSHHVGRIVRQIAHRYPRMGILGLAGPEADLLTDVLSAVGSSFSSFTVGVGAVRNLDEHVRILESTNREVLSLPLDLTKDFKTQLGSEKFYDLVLLSTSQLENDYVPDILKSISAVMKSGGFLIVVQLPKTPMKDLLLRTPKAQDGKAGASTPPEWPDALDTYSFIPVAKNCNQSYYPGYSVMVRQLSSPQLELIKQPSQTAGGFVTDHLLIIGGVGEMGREFADRLRRLLVPLCQDVSLRATFDDADSTVLNECTSAIILEDLYKPLMETMTQQTLDRLRELLRPNMKVLWLTFEARFGNPYHAATFGFTRTVSAEIPSLALQMLDLEEYDGPASLVFDNFLRLMATGNGDDDKVLWSDEREIHIEGGRRIIPRILPLKESNNRVNAMRRVVSGPVNTVRRSVEVVPSSTSAGLVRYAARIGSSSTRNPCREDVSVQVDYSSAEAFRLEIDAYGRFDSPAWAYICYGYNVNSSEQVIAISASNASRVSLPREQVYAVKPNADLGMPLISLAMRYLMASMIAIKAGNQRVVLIDSDPILTQCVAEVVSDNKKGGPVTWYSTSPSEVKCGEQTPLPLHPHGSARQIKAVFPPAGAAIFDFLPQERAKLSKQISEMLPANCEYYSCSELCSSSRMADSAMQQDYRWKKSWQVAALKASKSKITGTQGNDILDAVSVADLQSNANTASSPFQIIDWRANRIATRFSKPVVAEQLFRPDRTYVLIGLTKDFGQSLCYLLVEHGARNIALASRKPNLSPKWTEELAQAYGATVAVCQCDATDINSVRALKKNLSESMPSVAGVANGAMVLDDRVFAQMDEHTWNRVLQPKTVGSQNLDRVFDEPDLEFFIMTSSFAAIGGHPGQSNYAAANMYMNGLAGERRRRGRAGSVLNIGVIYGIGFLQREKEELYTGLEREGYPPISERDIHHMFLEAVVAGRPGEEGQSNPPIDITTGLRRFDPADPNPLHWHQDPRFSHYTREDRLEDVSAAGAGTRKSLRDTIAELTELDAVVQAILLALTDRLETLLRLPKEAISPAHSMSELGVDSLAAIEVRGWIFKVVDKDVSVIKLLGGTSIQKLCAELAEQIVVERSKVKSGDAN